MNKEGIIALLKTEVLPTTGCTEPGAIALAAAYASNALAVDAVIRKVKVSVNANVYKNGIAVGIPGTGETGLHIAAALGVVKRHPENQLAVLSNVTSEELSVAKNMVAKGIVDVSLDEQKANLWVKVRVEAELTWSEAVIQDKHTNLVSLQRNGEYLFEANPLDMDKQSDHRQILRGEYVSIAEIVVAIEDMPDQELDFVLEGIDMNLIAAKTGISKKLGMGIGAMYQDMVTQGLVSDDMINYAKLLTAAAADARMSGENIQVMSSAGSGNHGITVILPVYAVAQKTGVSRQRLNKAVALSHLITVYIKMHTGNLSALCGCAVAAATGATAAITWMMGGNLVAIEAAMKNVIANLTGMICDGGKVGCALKLSTAAAVAVESSLLAQQNIVVPATNGIIAETIEQTIINLGKISNPGMIVTDKIIMDVMLDKNKEMNHQ